MLLRWTGTESGLPMSRTVPPRRSPRAYTRFVILAAVLLLSNFAGCKPRESISEEERERQEEINRASIYPRKAFPPEEHVLPCRENDADCPAGYICDRKVCASVHGRPEDRLDNRFGHLCDGGQACIERNGTRLLCLQGRCRSCLTAEDCALGGERAGWYCITGRHCSTSPHGPPPSPPPDPSAPQDFPIHPIPAEPAPYH